MLNDLTRRGVESAVAEFDRIGREAFLAKYEFGKARGYFLVVNGRRYDSKAICGAAYGYDFPAVGALRPADFSGGNATVARVLGQLGYQVERPTSTGVI